MNATTAIAQSRFFEGMGAASRKVLAGISRRRTLERGDLLFTEGSRGDEFYLVGTGRLQLYKTDPAGREVVVRIVQPGDVFAEVVLFERDRYPVTALALTAAEVFGLPRGPIHTALAEEHFRTEFIGNLMRKLRFLTQRLVYLSTTEAEDRLFQYLEEQGPGGHAELKLTKKQVAAAIGTTPETLSRLIKRLGSEGRLKWTGKSVSWTRSVTAS